MRACEGCRKRKIKCDAATTNSWPCASCVRLKQSCVPPSVNYNRSHIGMTPTSGLERVIVFGDSSGESDNETFMPRPAKRLAYKRPEPLTTKADYMPGIDAFNASSQPAPIIYDPVTTPSLSTTDEQYYAHQMFQPHVPIGEPPRPPDTGKSWPPDAFSVADLQDVMGSLKVHDNGTGEPEAQKHFGWQSLTLHSSLHCTSEENTC